MRLTSAHALALVLALTLPAAMGQLSTLPLAGPPTLPPLAGASTVDPPGSAPGTGWALTLADATLRIGQDACAPCIALLAEVDALPPPAGHERLQERLLAALDKASSERPARGIAPCVQLVFYAVRALVDEDRARALVALTRPVHCP